MRKEAIILQPGAFGDIIACLPIAYEYYTRDYKVFWPMCKKYMGLFDNIWYAQPIGIDDIPNNTNSGDWLKDDYVRSLEWVKMKNPEVVLDLCDRGVSPQQLPSENFEEYKYRVAGVDIAYKNNLRWSRNRFKEKELYELYGCVHRQYDVVINNAGNEHISSIPITEESIIVKPIGGYNIFDYYKILVCARSIHTPESAFAQFIEGIEQFPNDVKLYLYKRKGQYLDTIRTHNWILTGV